MACDAPWLRGCVMRRVLVHGSASRRFAVAAGRYGWPPTVPRLHGRTAAAAAPDRGTASCSRSFAPTTSIGWLRSCSRSVLKFGRPVSFSAIHFLANSPRLDLREHLLHRLLGLGGDDARAGRVVAVLGGVADRVAHVAAGRRDTSGRRSASARAGTRSRRSPAGSRPRPASRTRPSPARSCRRTAPPARRRDRSRSPRRTSSRSRRRGCSRCRARRPAPSLGPCPVASWCTASRPGVPRAFLEHLAHAMARRLGRHHRHVHVRRRHDPVEADVEAVREHQHLARGEVRLDVGLVDLAPDADRG